MEKETLQTKLSPMAVASAINMIDREEFGRRFTAARALSAVMPQAVCTRAAMRIHRRASISLWSALAIRLACFNGLDLLFWRLRGIAPFRPLVLSAFVFGVFDWIVFQLTKVGSSLRVDLLTSVGVPRLRAFIGQWLVRVIPPARTFGLRIIGTHHPQFYSMTAEAFA